MSLVSTCIKRLLFVFIFCPMSKHKKGTIRCHLHSGAKSYKLVKHYHCLLEKNIQAEGGFFLRQRRL